MIHSVEAKRILEHLDVEGARKLWPVIMPHLPPLGDNSHILQMLHMTRTQINSIKFRLRAYSHAWLTERSLPSMLPDHMRPRAQRLYPVVVATVGVSARNRLIKGTAGPIVQKAMEGAVLEAEADGRLEDDDFVRGRIIEARLNTLKKLFG